MNFDFKKTKKDFNDVEEYLRQEYLQISTGRVSPALIDSIFIDSYGSQQAIKNIASITIEDARTMKITPWDKSQIKSIEKAIYDSKLPLSISIDESGVRVNIPQLTEENKKEVVKILKDKLELARVNVRNIRQEKIKTIKQMEEQGMYNEDIRKKSEEELQKIVDETNKKLKELFNKKEEAIMSV